MPEEDVFSEELDFPHCYSRQVSAESFFCGRDWEVEFSVLRKVGQGDEVLVVGSTESLGMWDLSKAVPMGTSPDDYPRWCCTVIVPPEEQPPEGVQYKFVVKRDGSRPAVWEAGANRDLDDDAGRLATPWFGQPAPQVGACHEVVFEAQCGDTRLGDSVVVVGSVPSLGEWDPVKGLVLSTDDARFPWWTGSALIPIDRPPVSWKLAITSPHRPTPDWESGDNRRMLPPSGEAASCERWSLRAHYGGASSAPQPCIAAQGDGSAKADETGMARRMTSQPKHPDVMKASFGSERPDPSTMTRTYGSMPDLCMMASEIGSEPGSPRSQGKELSRNRWPPSIVPEVEAHEVVLNMSDASDALDGSGVEGADVSVVIEGVQTRHQLRYDPVEQRWLLALAKLGLSPGVYQFHFLVGDMRLLSSGHPQVSSWNVVLYSDPLRRYVAARSAGQEMGPSPTHRPLEKAKRQKESFSYSGAGGISLEEQVLKEMSTAISSKTMAKHGDGSEPVVFGEEVWEGLFDGNLRFYLHGHALPPTDPLHGKPPDVQLWAGARRLMKVGGPVCEDACFYASHALGVADGVGGMKEYASYGVDASAYAEELLRIAAGALSPGGCAAENSMIVELDGGGGKCCPELRAVTAVRAAEQGAEAFGAATVVVSVVQGSTLGVANLGDSGFMVLRKSPHGMSIVTRSEDQQHPGFNTPYQLMRLPPALTERQGLRIRFIDTAADCQTYLFNLRVGDLILVFTDGLRDNLHDHEILDIANRVLPPSLAELAGVPEHATPPECIARSLAFAARERSMDKSAQVPWVEYCRKKGHLHPGGGKIDDITVVAAWAVPA